MSWFGLFSDVKQIASEVIEDPDLRNKLLTKLNEAQLEVQKVALQTKTIPWVDALHKMSRPLISVITVCAPITVLLVHPEIDLQKLLMVTVGGSVPAGIYTKMKGRGN